MLVDGQPIGKLGTDEQAASASRPPSLLATLPEVTFFRRYAATFGQS